MRRLAWAKARTVSSAAPMPRELERARSFSHGDLCTDLLPLEGPPAQRPTGLPQHRNASRVGTCPGGLPVQQTLNQGVSWSDVFHPVGLYPSRLVGGWGANPQRFYTAAYLSAPAFAARTTAARRRYGHLVDSADSWPRANPSAAWPTTPPRRPACTRRSPPRSGVALMVACQLEPARIERPGQHPGPGTEQRPRHPCSRPATLGGGVSSFEGALKADDGFQRAPKCGRSSSAASHSPNSRIKRRCPRWVRCART